MPALLVHLTLADMALADQTADREIRDAGREHPDALLLGSIWPDLPYHAHFGRQLIRHLRGKPYLLSEWGDIFHTRRTGRLALAMLEHLRRSHLPRPERRRVLALAAGYLCHHAADRVTHPFIQALVARNIGSGEPAQRLHTRFEHIQNILFHHDEQGEDIAGGPFALALVSRVAGAGLLRPRLDPTLWQGVRAACLEAHGRAPSECELRDWLFGVTAYGAMMSSPMGLRERLSGDRDELRRRWYQGGEVDLRTPLLRSVEQTHRAWRRAAQLLSEERVTDEVRSAFLREVPDLDLGMGA